MKKKFLGRLLTMLLVAAMVFTLLPASAIAADWWGSADEYADDVSTQAATDDYYKIVHLDCGRKYFSKDWIIALLYEMQNDGYNQLQLAFGNDGLRFLLDDMSFTANGTTYSHDTVVQRVESGNKAQNSSNDARWLTQAEMDEIIAKAKELGIEIVPLLNLPGHANTILDIANDQYNASGSNNTLDVAGSDEAQAFGKAIFAKYLDYFAEKGCNFFNFGADEYANDASGSFSFSRLDNTQYQKFVSFINDLAGQIIQKGMTPRAFNDGLYYNGKAIDKSANKNIQSIQCCYWSPGWNGYNLAAASTIANNSHSMINTNGDFYYVLGKDDKFDNGYTYAEKFDSQIFPTYNSYSGSWSTETISNPAGSMFCIWCDYPNAESETEVAKKTRLVLRAMALRMDNQSINSVSDGVIENGFNADGTLNTTKSETGITIVDSATGKVPTTMTTEGTLTLSANKVVTWTADPADIVNLINLKNGVSSQTIEVRPVKAGTVTITATDPDTETLAASITLTVTDPSAAKNNKTINLTVDGSDTENVEGANYSNKVNREELDEKIATVTVTGKDASKTNPEYKETTVTAYTLANRKTSWTKTNYYLKVDESYYPVYAYVYRDFWTTEYHWGYSPTDSANDIHDDQYTDSYDKKVAVYTKTSDGTDTPASTTITFTGVAPGTTYVTVGDTKYTINVSVDPAKLEFWITNAAIQSIGNKTDDRTNAKSEKYTVHYSEILASAAGVNTADGIDIATIAPPSADHDSRKVYYWHSRMLDTTEVNDYGSKTGWQTNDGGDDETESGVAFTKIRYYNNQWEVYTANNEWVKVEAKHQLVAYYKEYLKVTDEVDSYASDWGNKGDKTAGGWLDTSNYCTLSIQVVYEDGTTNPNATTASALTSKSFVYGYWSQGRGIGTVIFNGNKDFEIVRVTAETGDATVNFGTAYAAEITKLDWDGNELDVWDDSNGSDEVVIHNSSNNFTKDGKYANLVWDENKEAILLRVYVRAKITEDSLTVNYIDNDGNKQFYSYNIAVKQGTYFDSNIGLANDWKGPLANGTVKNIKDVTQTVSADLSTMPAIGAQYRYVDYTCTKVETIKDDAGNIKTVNLYYTFSNAVKFIADFGLPLTIEPENVNASLTAAGVNLNSVTVAGASGNAVTVNGTTVTYTPNADFEKSKNGVSFTLTYQGQIEVTENGTTTIQEGSVGYNVTIIPASNVLYEENFLTQGSEQSSTNVTRHTWSENKFDANKVQQTQKQDEDQIFGKDTAYEGITAAAGYWTVGNLNSSKDGTTSLTTSFFGNALDVIGSCGPNTGRVMITIKDSAGKAVQSVLVDTRYSAGSIDQVPLAHIELGGTDANYTAVIRGYARPSTSAQSASSPLRTYSYNSASYDALTADLAAMGLTMADVKVVSASEAAAKVASTQSAAQTYALNSTESTGATVTIDGFRVYRSADVEAYSSLDNEYKMIYKNILDVMDDKIITAYVDNTTVTDCNVNDYEAEGGPQNEIYLSQNQSVVFQIADNNVKSIQVSLRAVDGTAEWSGGKITSNTEMYYTLSSDNEGNFTIANSSDSLLAIGNVKLPAGSSVVKTSALSKDTILASVRMALNAAPVDPEPEQPTFFVPEHFSIRDYATRFFRSKLVTLRIDFSKDVSYVEIDGCKYTPNKLASWFGYYTVTFTDTIGRNDDYSYEVVFFDANNNPSETQIVYGK